MLQVIDFRFEIKLSPVKPVKEQTSLISTS